MITIFLFAGEQSGDVLGAALMQELKSQLPEITFYGVGGKAMRSVGIASTMHMEQFQVMGFSDVLKALPKLYFLLLKIAKEICLKQPEAVILIDYADFNMRLAKVLRKRGYKGKIIHYVSPSVWAWRKKRISHLAKYLDLLITILPFEKKYYSKTTLNVTYAGHPLVHKIKTHVYDTSWKKECAIPEDKMLLAVFPGSRLSEIRLNLKLQLASAAPLLHNNPDLALVISVASPHLQHAIESIVTQTGLTAHYASPHYAYELMQLSKTALATCGTVILELALHQTPTVVTYVVSPFNYFLVRFIFRIRLPFFSLPNIILDRELFPECIGLSPSRLKITQALKKLMETPLDFCALENQLQDLNSSREAARAIKKLLGRN